MIWSGGLHPAREDNQTSGCGSFSKTLNCQLGQKSILLTQGDLVWPEKCGKPEIYLLPSLNEWETSLPKLQQLIDCFLCSCFFTVLLFVLLPYLLFVCSCLLYFFMICFFVCYKVLLLFVFLLSVPLKTLQFVESAPSFHSIGWKRLLVEKCTFITRVTKTKSTRASYTKWRLVLYLQSANQRPSLLIDLNV